jgi:hypothetical protein
MITKKIIAEQLNNYLLHKISLTELVDWAEKAILVGKFEEKNYKKIRDVLAQIGLADVRNFGLDWENCEQILNKIGYAIKIDIFEEV